MESRVIKFNIFGTANCMNLIESNEKNGANPKTWWSISMESRKTGQFGPNPGLEMPTETVASVTKMVRLVTRSFQAVALLIFKVSKARLSNLIMLGSVPFKQKLLTKSRWLLCAVYWRSSPVWRCYRTPERLGRPLVQERWPTVLSPRNTSPPMQFQVM